MRKTLVAFIMLFCILSFYAQIPSTYPQTYNYLTDMLTDKRPLNFKEAVFTVENAYFEGQLDMNEINRSIETLSYLTKVLSETELITYQGKDKDIVTKHASLFKLFTDTVPFFFDPEHILIHTPYTYDFEDIQGETNWSKMFVTKLLETRTGNCHSMPYLYKMVSDELKIPCYLSFAPSHIYLKLYAETTGWYNTELTSAMFPVDAWIMASGYINTDAIRNGLYMDTLSNKQAVAHCLVDLAQGYQHKYGKENPEFVIQCCNTALVYHSANVSAMLTKAEAQKSYIQRLQKNKQVKNTGDLFGDPHVQAMYSDMENTYVRLHELGYRQMPEEMYRKWMEQLKNKTMNFNSNSQPSY